MQKNHKNIIAEFHVAVVPKLGPANEQNLGGRRRHELAILSKMPSSGKIRLLTNPLLIAWNLKIHGAILRPFRKYDFSLPTERLPIVTNVPKFTVVTQFDLIQSS